MSEPVILALIVLIPSVCLPTIILLLNNRAARRSKEYDAKTRKDEKEAEYARADLIEARRKAETEEVARLLKNNTAVQVESAGQLKGQIQQVHTLVNSNLTEEMEQRLVVMQTGLTSLIEISDLRKSMGHPENQETNSQIDIMRERITKLTETIGVRRAVTDAAAVEKRTTETATKAAVAALTAAGPIPVQIQQDESQPVPVRQMTEVVDTKEVKSESK